MNEMDEIMRMWKKMDEKLSVLARENQRLALEVRKNKYRSSLERLVNKYWKFIILETVCLLLFPLMIIYNPLVVEKYRWITAIYWCCLFAFELGVDYYLMSRLRALDVCSRSVREISLEAQRNWKIHKIAIIIGFPVAIGAVILFALSLNADPEILAGMTVGGVIGLVIGISELRKFMRDYKNLQEEDSPEET